MFSLSFIKKIYEINQKKNHQPPYNTNSNTTANNNTKTNT